jgi:hypothetical protein
MKITVDAVINNIREFCIHPETGSEGVAASLALGVSVASDTISGISVGVRAPLALDDGLTDGLRSLKGVGVGDKTDVAAGVKVIAALRLPFGLIENVRL